MMERLQLFRTVLSIDQLSVYGAVSDLCEKYKSCPVRTGRFVVKGQFDRLFVPKSSLMKTPTPLTDLSQEDLLHKYQAGYDNKIV